MKKLCAFIDRIYYPLEGNLMFALLICTFAGLAMGGSILGGVVGIMFSVTLMILLSAMENQELSKKEEA